MGEIPVPGLFVVRFFIENFSSLLMSFLATIDFLTNMIFFFSSTFNMSSFKSIFLIITPNMKGRILFSSVCIIDSDFVVLYLIRPLSSRNRPWIAFAIPVMIPRSGRLGLYSILMLLPLTDSRSTPM